ncbi:hypothetical protein TRVA0_060S00254 [Trichomonascus vanleenenianus]|uniref:mitochondrial 54S ribosomal protein bL9m MRPL50 n=1 Tax=Trichomonascus vanleenenianus TaxID=2268995 RepID=UPI003EC9F533
MLRSRLSTSIQKRFASTRVAVQLLRDVPGLGYRGEVVKVPAGRMRNELHVKNGAAYVVKGEPLRIPLRTREQVEAELAVQKKTKAAASAAQETQSAVDLKAAAQQARQDKLRSLANLQFGVASSKSLDTASPAALYLLENALRSIPKILPLKLHANPDGTLQKDYTIDQAVAHITKLTGEEIPASIAKFSVRTGTNSDEFAWAIDHVGKYRLMFEIPDGPTLSFDLAIGPSNNLTDSVPKFRPFGPLKAGHELAARPISEPVAPQQTAIKPEETKKKVDTKSKEAEPSKRFEWENTIVSSLQDKMKR